MSASSAHFILYVADQARSAAFYAATLNVPPRLDVPGMTEFSLGENAVLGLMPERGIARLLQDSWRWSVQPSAASGNPAVGVADPAPRAELYLLVDTPEAYIDRAITAGAAMLSPLIPRPWGHDAGYLLAPDGHILAFARASR